ncbi:reverse transcriptase domain-containing protein [Tanacetum coccineum]
MMMYLAASTKSINTALFAKREEEQVPIYFVSRVLQEDKLNYLGMEKLILTLTITKPEKSRRVAKWAIELGENDTVFKKRGDKTPKDFLIEVPLEDNEKKAEEKADKKLTKTDAGLMLIDPEGKEYTYALRFGFETTNNEAEYEALLVGLRISQEMEITSLAIFVDSQLLVNQIKVLPKRSAEEKEILQVKTKEGESWMTPIYEYLVSGLLSEDPKESRKIKVKAPQYKLIRGNLYRRSLYSLWLHCVASPQTYDIVKEIRSATNNQLEGRDAFLRRNFHRSLQRIKSHTILLSYYRAYGNNEPYRKTIGSKSTRMGSEAIIPIPENDVTKDDRGRIKEVDKRRGNKEIASVEEAYYRSKLHRHHSERSSHTIYKIGDLVLLSQSNTGGTQVWQGPHMISEVYGEGLYKIVDASYHSLTQTAKSMNLRKFYM